MVREPESKINLRNDAENKNIFVITLKGDDKHFLNPDLVKSFLQDLSDVKSEASKDSILITTAEGKYFSGGFDFSCCAKDGNSKEVCKYKYLEMITLFKQLVAELISFPIPTIAAVNGYAKNAGLVLAMSHDYLTMKSDEGVLTLSELDRKMTLPDYFTALIRSKVSPGGWCRFALKSFSFDAEEAKSLGLMVHSGDSTEEPWETAKKKAMLLAKMGWGGQVYAETRKALYPELCSVLGLCYATVVPSRL